MVRRAMRLFFFVFAGMSVAACQPSARLRTAESRAGADTRLEAQVDAILTQQQKEMHIPGLAFAVVKGDEVVYLKAFGLRDIERNLPATPDTVFPIGSCTKAFTSMAAAISQDEGLLSLDDHPRRFLPYFKMADPEADARVTLRDMLSHRTGLMAKADLAAEPGVLTRAEYVQAATSAKPTAKFRAAFQYSNAMFSAAGEIVGKANRSTWEDVVERKILRPLGMTSSLASALDMSAAVDHATGYVFVDGEKKWLPVPTPRGFAALAPAGSIASSARDMTRWVRMLSNGGRIGAKRIVSESMLSEVVSGQVPINSTMSYALGWVTYDWNGLRVVEHNGGSEGISALVSFIPRRRVGFVFLANTSPNFMTTIGNAGKLLWPLILEGTPASSPPPAASARPHPAPKPGDRESSVNHRPPANAAELPAVDVLVQRMIAALGGEPILRGHTSLEIHAMKTYENQGVTAAYTVRARAPDQHVEEEVWTAAGREIGRIRVYFDGRRGGQETTFGQDATNDAADDDRARRDYHLHPLLALTVLYKEIHVLDRVKFGAEDAFVMELVPTDGPPARLYVSERSALVLQREADGQSETFDDYRVVDGELLPFRTSIRDELGETTIQVQDARFNSAIPGAAFGATKAGAGS